METTSWSSRKAQAESSSKMDPFLISTIIISFETVLPSMIPTFVDAVGFTTFPIELEAMISTGPTISRMSLAVSSLVGGHGIPLTDTMNCPGARSVPLRRLPSVIELMTIRSCKERTTLIPIFSSFVLLVIFATTCPGSKVGSGADLGTGSGLDSGTSCSAGLDLGCGSAASTSLASSTGAEVITNSPDDLCTLEIKSVIDSGQASLLTATIAWPTWISEFASGLSS
mmetsp:Transcript_17224/g.41965  ORF Transcript_17224/g.41965 Transcript_17224/m.41965 type:complete len:227 (+) Transcript_17224:2870-3550(+)